MFWKRKETKEGEAKLPGPKGYLSWQEGTWESKRKKTHLGYGNLKE
jgi:hypothetical protein